MYFCIISDNDYNSRSHAWAHRIDQCCHWLHNDGSVDKGQDVYYYTYDNEWESFLFHKVGLVHD